MTTTPDPAIVAIYNLDPDSLFAEPGAFCRLDGTPASSDEIEAVGKRPHVRPARRLDMHKHALEQSRYELQRKERITEILHRYARGYDNEQIAAIEQRMTLADWVEYRALWDELGNFMVLDGQ